MITAGGINGNWLEETRTNGHHMAVNPAGQRATVQPTYWMIEFDYYLIDCR